MLQTTCVRMLVHAVGTSFYRITCSIAHTLASTPTSRKFEISSETLFFLFSAARSLRSQISPILSTRNSMATDRAFDDHEQLIPNRHCAIFVMPENQIRGC